MAKITIIANGSKQSGKSTTTLNLGLCFATIAENTLIIDLNNSWLAELCNPDSLKSIIRLSPFLSYLQLEELKLSELEDYCQVLINCPIHKNKSAFEIVGNKVNVLIPVECEYYGLNSLPEILNLVGNYKSARMLPVLYKEGSSGSEVIGGKLKEHFGDMVIWPSIQRNYYLSRQKDFKSFSLSKLTEKAAFSYLECANELKEI